MDYLRRLHLNLATLITDKLNDSNRFLTLQGKSNHTTYEHPRVSYGNLSQSHLRDLPHRTPSQGFCAYLLTPGGEPAAFQLDHQFLALPEGVRPEGRTTLSIHKILQVSSVYRAHNTACD